MKLKRICDTCYNNHRDCSYLQSHDCLFTNLSEWKPYTNAEWIQDMEVDELADYIMRARGMVEHMICDDCHDGCWFDCKTNHHCNGGNDSCMVTKEDVLRWLKSEVRVDGDM